MQPQLRALLKQKKKKLRSKRGGAEWFGEKSPWGEPIAS